MLAPDLLLNDLQALFSRAFTDAIVWEQRDSDLVGKYVYIRYCGREIGIFMGYHMGQSGSVKGAITFLFAHPASSPEETKEVNHLFHKLLIRLNLRMRENRYRIAGGRAPAIIRMVHFGEKGFSIEKSTIFFSESIDAIKRAEPLFKAISR